MTRSRPEDALTGEQTVGASGSPPPQHSESTLLSTPAPGDAGRLERAIGVALLIIAAAWAAWPLPGPVAPVGSISDSNGDESGLVLPTAERPVLDSAAFQIPLWQSPTRLPPPPPPDVAATPPAPPVRLQLLAIVREAGAYAAICYDPAADGLLVLHEGDTSQGRTVERITGDELSLRDERGLVTLSILSGAGASVGAGGRGGGWGGGWGGGGGGGT